MSKVERDLNQISIEEKSCGTPRRPGIWADRIALLSARAEILNGPDRALMKIYLEKGSTFTQIAQMSGKSPASISRRIRHLVNSLLNGEYVFSLKNRDLFSDFERGVIKDYFLGKMSQKDTALKRGTSIYMVRKIIRKTHSLMNKQQ